MATKLIIPILLVLGVLNFNAQATGTQPAGAEASAVPGAGAAAAVAGAAGAIGQAVAAPGKLVGADQWGLGFGAMAPSPGGPASGTGVPPGTTVYDITKYGAKPGGSDIREALLAAWKEAVNCTDPSTVLIPPGDWFLSQAKLVGPGKAPIFLVIQGYLKADPRMGTMPDPKGEWITVNYIVNFTLTGGGVLDGMGLEAWKSNDCHKKKNCAKRPLNLSMNFMNNSVIRDITTKDSKNFHVNLIEGHNVTFLRFNVSAPGESINTDGMHIARSSGITVNDSTIATGDDCISVGDKTFDLHIHNTTCGPGHGISIGSLGGSVTEEDVRGVWVKNCTFTGTDNGIRIKTWPSAPATLKISDLVYEDLIMVNVSNPIVIDQNYCPHNLCNKASPSLIEVSNMTVNNVRGTCWTVEAIILDCSPAKPCQNICIGNVDLAFTGPVGPITTKCANAKPVLTGKQNPPVCAAPAQPAPAGSAQPA